MTGFDPVDQSSNLCITSPPFTPKGPRRIVELRQSTELLFLGSIPSGVSFLLQQETLFATVEKWSFRQAVILKSRVRFSAVALAIILTQNGRKQWEKLAKFGYFMIITTLVVVGGLALLLLL